MHKYLNEHFNDGKKYCLHYVTAREAYNIVKAAEHNHSGNPESYRNFSIPPYVASYYRLKQVHDVISCTEDNIHIQNIEKSDSACLQLKDVPASGIQGALEEVSITSSGTILECLLHDAQGKLMVTLSGRYGISKLEGAEITGEEPAPGGQRAVSLKPLSKKVRIELNNTNDSV